MNTIMKVACDEACVSMNNNLGGSFGAVIVDANGDVIAKGSNRVLERKDPTQHAEIVAIQEACKTVGSYDLSGYVLYTTCEPCPMCLSACIWANIKIIYYGATREDAEKIGFRDNYIYEHINGKEKAIEIINIDGEECKKLFDEYSSKSKTIY